MRYIERYTVGGPEQVFSTVICDNLRYSVP